MEQFSRYITLGNTHLEKQNFTERETNPFGFYENEKVYISDLETGPVAKIELEGSNQEKEYSVLIIEDNEDLRLFLCSYLFLKKMKN